MSRRGKKQNKQVQQPTTPVVCNIPVKDQQILPRQLEDLLKAAIKHYGNRHFDKAIENCDKILAHFPSNGEAFSLLAACQYSKGPKKVNVEDILGRLKKGLIYNFGSNTCWHLYGIILRTEKHYEEAAKAFKRLVSLDRTNFGIQRELYCLQVQNGDYKGAFETRSLLFSAQSDIESNLLGRAVAADLNGQTEVAIETMELYQKKFINKKTSPNDKSDSLSYIISLYKQKGDYKNALKLITENEHILIDKVVTLERTAELYLLLKENDKALELYKKLLSINSDKVEYYYGIAHCLGVDINNLGNKKDEFVSICKQYSHRDEDTAAVIILRALPANDEFILPFKNCLIKLIQKHIITVDKLLHCLFMKELSFESEKKYDIYVNILDTLKNELTDNEDLQFLNLTNVQRLIVKSDIAQARVVFDSIKIETPTIENLMVKARLLKKENKLPEAAEAMDAARQLDKSDRYLANRTCKYYMRYGKVEKGLEIFKLFDRSPDKNDSPNKFDERLDDLEVVWFLTEYANGLYVAEKYAEAESVARRVIKAFTTYQEDLFDFHSYIFNRFSADTYLACVRCCKDYANSPYKKRAEKILADITSKKTDPQA
ncbi:NMDA receptor-regulated protein, putative [Entamoeba dispar SAW760]|uniref:NMDA receptor-regulated protein, putative n=1 Tax=Entamoeba dispar (strain ATCC PRA-260 / SAW760) TaxID=370354 RepID=B0E8W4_ENTDS|nr:NMDA receptor-regulated protein, putative [Entamoeba dispar SAW760]EDR29028.1 NMDA receptor-regulated protein, putative [Entamoeba dispar SAW760]|eukprot:EDR29028.1 NMDA receptor-regulated protein, putative [Entamoeba dispar SAW760]